MEPGMPSSKKNTRAAKTVRPRADATCTLSRTVERGAQRLDVWNCLAPQRGEPLDEPPQISFAPVLRRIGRRGRLWRFFYVTRAQAEGEDAYYEKPGWYFEAVH